MILCSSYFELKIFNLEQQILIKWLSIYLFTLNHHSIYQTLFLAPRRNSYCSKSCCRIYIFHGFTRISSWSVYTAITTGYSRFFIRKCTLFNPSSLKSKYFPISFSPVKFYSWIFKYPLHLLLSLYLHCFKIGIEKNSHTLPISIACYVYFM